LIRLSFKTLLWCGILMLASMLPACGKKEKESPKPSSEKSAASSPPAAASDRGSDRERSAKRATLKLPNPRHKLLEAEWGAYSDIVIRNDASNLPENERQMLGHLLEAAKVVEELHMLQLHPENLKWRDTLTAIGADIEKKLFFRNQMPWCEDNDDADCRVLDEVPKKREIGFMHWPEGFTADDVKALSSEINGRELLSPFTVVRRKSGSGYLAIPYSRNELLGPKMRRLSALLSKAAKSAPDKSLKAFLASRAEALTSSNPFPYDKSDLDWIAVKGDWEVTVGPYEVYKNPFQTKALFEMYIGRENKPLSDELSKLKGRLQEMENALAALVGEEVYKPRTLDTDIAIRAIDVWMASGDARNSRGATVAFHLPNRGEAITKGLCKKVMLVNHSMVFEAVAKARAEQVLEPTQAAMVNFKDSITNTIFHELSHGFGAHHEMVIADKEGRRITVKEALRSYDSLMEELKADATGLWLSKYLYDQKTLSVDALTKRYVSNLVHLLGLLHYPLNGTYPKMAAIQLGWFLDHGGVVWHSDAKQLQVNVEKMSESVVSLTKTVATLQLVGDYQGAKTLCDKHMKTTDTETTLSGILSEIRSAIIEKFKASGIKSPSLRYKVTGI
jgi:hypothetical protein